MWKFLAAVAVIALAVAIYPAKKQDEGPPNGWFELPAKGERGCHALTGDSTPANLYQISLSANTSPRIIDYGDEVDVENDYNGERAAVRYFRTIEACTDSNDKLAAFEAERAKDLKNYLAKYTDSSAQKATEDEVKAVPTSLARTPDPPGSAVSLCQKPRRMTRDGCQ